MNIYIASSWKNQHAVEMLTARLRHLGHEVKSFVENNNFEHERKIPFDEWVWTAEGAQSFEFDTDAAMNTDLVIYIGPSGCDAWAGVGAAWAAGTTIFGLISKAEPIGLMRRMVTWFDRVDEMIDAIEFKRFPIDKEKLKAAMKVAVNNGIMTEKQAREIMGPSPEGDQ